MRRRRVLEAAVEAIADVGVERLRMTDIARRADMTPGHILYYFERKERILAETLRWSEEELAVRRRQMLNRARTRRGRLHRFIDLYLPDDRDDPRWNLWTQLLVQTPDDAIGALLDRLNNLWRDDLTELLDGDRRHALQLCYVMDGLAWDMLSGAALTRAQAVKIARGMLDGQ
jgi:AcrR family transcriptional regulator